MSTAIALVTHPGIGSALRAQAEAILATSLAEVTLAELDSGRRESPMDLAAVLDELDQGEGVLLLTDLPGATPCNRARKAAPANSVLISGLNLPMLIRAWNYRQKPLDELARLVVEGGRAAIMEPD